ncbi:hypothetical protein DFJ74DRAFT_702791 [Hyaloraphidium curvatum]|nr:hypothetical protein DFJ74DRAFT_702791 [Hyaloraphidium curvatum]
MPSWDVVLAQALSGLYCWGQAVLLQAPLLSHVDGDDLCPCHRCCSRTVLVWSFWERVLRTVPLNSFNVFVTLSFVWTPVVFYGSSFWTSGAYIAAGVLLLTATLMYNVVSMVGRFGSYSSAETLLETRIYLRASFRAIEDLLRRYRHRLLLDPSDDDGAVADDVHGNELYVRLHLGYRAKWERSRAVKAFDRNIFMGLALALMPFALLFGAVINLAAGGCVTMWTIMQLVVTLYVIVVGVAELPAINSQIDALSKMYLDAVFAIRGMLMDAASLPRDPRRDAAVRELEAHAGFLATFGSVESLRATFVGIPVTWGLAKTLLVTIITLGVALWSVLRGVGVVFTLQSVCPL